MSEHESERLKRLGEALRENLKRRKSQSRGRAAPPQEKAGVDTGEAAGKVELNQSDGGPIKTP